METRLYVGNLSDEVSAPALRERFAEFGEVFEVTLATDRGSGRFRGHAFVTMATASDAQNAMKHLNGAFFEERRLRVNVAGEERATKERFSNTHPAKITAQFRTALGMVYELDCDGVKLTIKTTPEDASEKAWRVEASIAAATEANGAMVIAASAPSRAAAFAEVSRLWKEDGANTLIVGLDWSAITKALSTVRAI
jgi:hypothetical protein